MPAIHVGAETEFPREELIPLQVKTAMNGLVTEYPQVKDDQYVICAFNQWGVAGKAKMFLCNTQEQMNEMVRAYLRGGALKIDWYASSAKHVITNMIKNQLPPIPVREVNISEQKATAPIPSNERLRMTRSML